MGFYENYVRLCNSIGKKPGTVAEEVGITRATSSRWSRGMVPSYASLLKIADYFNVTVRDLVGATNATSATLAKRYGIAQEMLMAVEEPDEGLEEYLEELRSRPETKTLLAASRGMTRDQVTKMAAFMAEMKKGWND